MQKYDLLYKVCMYVYFPDQWFGDDKVAWATGVTWNAWDFIFLDWQEAILLWEECAASELIKGHVTVVKAELIYAWLLTQKALTTIHFFVWERFTTYSNTIPLRLWNDFSIIMKRCIKKWSKTMRSWQIDKVTTWWVNFIAYNEDRKQQLLVCPDLRTMHQQIPARVFDQPWVSRWHAWLTALQKATIFWWIKTGQIHTLITTPAWVFQDRMVLWDIFVIDEHKRWYKAAQDPRWRTPSVCKTMQQVYWAHYCTSWYIVDTITQEEDEKNIL